MTNEILKVLEELKKTISELPNGLEAMREVLEGSVGLRDLALDYLLSKTSIEDVRKGLEG